MSVCQEIENNFYSLGVTGGMAFMGADKAFNDYQDTKFKSGAAFSFSPLYHFAPSALDVSFHFGAYVGHHSMELTEQSASFGTLNSTEIMVVFGLGKYAFEPGTGFLKADLGLGTAITSFDNGSYLNDVDAANGVKTNVSTDNAFALALSGEGGIFLTKSVSLSGQLLMLVENVGNRWTMTGNGETVPIKDFGDMLASSIQVQLSFRYWGFQEEVTK